MQRPVTQVISFVRAELKDDPSRLNETLSNLEQQRQEIHRRSAIK
jgi:hypothetical protein